MNNDINQEQPISSRPPKKWYAFLGTPFVMLSLALGLAIGMWLIDFQPVSSDTTKLTVAYEPTITDDEMLDMNNPVWSDQRRNDISRETDPNGNPTNSLSTTVIPMSGQYIAPQEGGSILQVKARAVFNDKTMAVRVEWQDNTKNLRSVIGTNEYSDAVALEFPLKLVAGHQPFRCMGQSDAQVNIWQWKAEREKAVTGDGRIVVNSNNTAVKNYLGPALGYLKDSPLTSPDSTASYNEQTKTWTVIFRRGLGAGDEKNATRFKPGEATLIAFAVWDGGAGERLSKKAVSTWVDFIYQPGESTTQSIINILTMGGLGLMMVVVIILAWKMLPTTTRPNRE